MSNKKCWVQLGRQGDIINILPLLYQAAKYSGVPSNLLVSLEYAPLLEGVSYVSPIIHHGDFADLNTAIRVNRSRFKEFLTTQVYAHGLNLPHHTPCFLQESWHRVGRASDWGTIDPIFDRRSAQREDELRRRFIKQKPVILVAPRGLSSPFHHWRQLFELLHVELSATHDIVDLANLRAHRFYDLLGLMDSAKALVTIDTGHMHLARASKIPVIALVTDGPTPWHTSAPMPGQIHRLKYSEFPSRAMEVIDAIKSIKGGRSAHPHKPRNSHKYHNTTCSSSTRNLIHVYSDYQRQGDSLRRFQFAQKTWAAEYLDSPWVASPITNDQLSRDSASVFGDTRHLPFIKDLINSSIEITKAKPNDIIVLTNDDIACTIGIGKWLMEVTEQRAAWSNRWDFSTINSPLDSNQCRTGSWCVGSDTFAFTRDWWERHSSLYPDMVLACEAWDWVMRELIRDHGGFELHAVTYHIAHPSYWQSGTNRFRNPGNVWNQRLAKSWLSERNKPLRELAPLKV